MKEDKTGIRWSEKQSEQRGLQNRSRDSVDPRCGGRRGSDDSFGDQEKAITVNNPMSLIKGPNYSSARALSTPCVSGTTLSTARVLTGVILTSITYVREVL